MLFKREVFFEKLRIYALTGPFALLLEGAKIESLLSKEINLEGCFRNVECVIHINRISNSTMYVSQNKCLTQGNGD